MSKQSIQPGGTTSGFKALTMPDSNQIPAEFNLEVFIYTAF